MENTSHVVVEIIPDREAGGFTARVPNIPAYGEGDSEEAAIADLKEALQGYIEEFGLEDAVARVSAPTTLRSLNWNLAELSRG